MPPSEPVAPKGRKRRAPTSAAMRAYRSVQYHLGRGKLVKPDRCVHCQKIGRTEAAHLTYKRPLDVLWLCRSCHVRWDHARPKGGTKGET